MTLVCTVGIPGAGKSTIRHLYEDNKNWATFSFDDLDIPSRTDSARINIAIKLLIEEVLLKITQDGKPIRTREQLEYIITHKKYEDSFNRKNKSFNAAIKDIITSPGCVGITEAELADYGCTMKQLEQNIEKNVWIKSLQDTIDQKIRDLKSQAYDNYVFDLGARHIPELIKLSQSGILSSGKRIKLIVIQINADPKKIYERWMSEIKKEDLDVSKYAIYNRSNFRNKFIELSGVPLEGDVLMRFTSALKLYTNFEEKFKEFVINTLNDRKAGIDNLASNSEYAELISKGIVHIIENSGTFEEFKDQFIELNATVIDNN